MDSGNWRLRGERKDQARRCVARPGARHGWTAAGERGCEGRQNVRPDSRPVCVEAGQLTDLARGGEMRRRRGGGNVFVVVGDEQMKKKKCKGGTGTGESRGFEVYAPTKGMTPL